MKRRIDKQKCYRQSTMCPLKVDLLSVTFDPETAEILSVIVTHPLAAIKSNQIKSKTHLYSAIRRKRIRGAWWR